MEESAQEQKVDSKDGTAAIVEGELKVEDPLGAGAAAKIIPSGNVACTVDGQPESKPFSVYAKNQVEITVSPDRHVTEEKVEVKVIKNGLEAEAAVFPRVTVYYYLQEQEPQNMLTLETYEVREDENPITASDIEKALKEAGVTYGVDSEAVEELVGTTEEWRVVARGKDPVEGSDGRVKYFFEKERQQIQYSETNNVNFREKFRLPSVKKGELLAVIEPPIPGKPGYTVMNEVLEARPVKEARIQCKDGVILDENSHGVYAIIAGRPLVRSGQVPQIRVDPVYIHNANVDMESGNLYFNGHLKIIGDVNEGMKVSADENLDISGNVIGAEILSGVDLTIQLNLINSRVNAGALKNYILQLQKKWNSFYRYFEALEIALVQIQEAFVEKDPERELKSGSIIKLLLQSKFKDYLLQREELEKFLNSFVVTPPSSLLRSASKALEDSSENRLISFDSVEDFILVKQKLENVSIILESLKVVTPVAVFSYVQNSSITAGGDLMINGSGCYNSTIIAAGKVDIKNSFRGGLIKSGGDVIIGKAGSPASRVDHGKIHVAHKRKIYLKVVHENTRVQVGNRGFTFRETTKNVRVFIDESGDIQTAYWEN